MANIYTFLKRGNSIPLGLVATAFIGIITAIGLASNPTPIADMRIDPTEYLAVIGDTFEVNVVVESSVPVNAFAGEITFNQDVLMIEAIDYNTSIADLWVEEPWYSNGAGTLNFAGGTTQTGGFEGEGTLVSITFKTMKEGEGKITTKDRRILLHDGLGTDSEIKTSIDTIFTVENEETKAKSLITDLSEPTPAVYKVVEELPSTDLNDDGKQSIADVSIFMINIGGDDSRYDFNLDGEVSLKDLNILLTAE